MIRVVMKSFVGKRPPGWPKRPEQPVIVVTRDEERAVRDSLHAFSALSRKIRHRADQILNRNPWAAKVEICNAKGDVLRSIKRISISDYQVENAETPHAGYPKGDIKQKARAKTSEKPVARPKSSRRGRPPGKRSDPEFTQTTAYVRTKTIEDVKIRLIKQGSNQDVSELIEELLSVWLRS